MAGLVFPDLARSLGAAAQLKSSMAQNEFLQEERAARASAAPFVAQALQGDSAAISEVATRHPETAMRLAPLLDRLDAGQRARAKEASEYTVQTGMAILNAPADQQPQLYAQARQDAQARGMDVSRWPTQYNPGWVKFNVDRAMPIAEHFKRSGEGVTYVDGGGATPAPAAPGDVLARTKQAIAGNESAGQPNGGYGAVGPDTGKGRAYGKYQIMDFNIGPWTQEALGRSMTPQEFLANPQAQEAVADHKLGQYIKQFGSPEAAARAWFAGPGGMNNANAKDVLGTTVGGYGQKFAQAYGEGATGPGPQVAQGDNTVADGSGTPLPPGGAEIPRETFRGIQLPPGYRIATQGGKIFSPVPGYVQVMPPTGGAPVLWPVPKPKEAGQDKGLFGDSLTGRALQALRSGDAASQDYAAAYAILSKPQVISDGAGGQTVIQPMDLSMYPKPTYGGGAAPSPSPAGAPAPTQIPGGGSIQNLPGKGRPLDNSARDDLTKASGGVLELTELVKSFDPSFGGFVLESKGDLDNWMKRNLPDGLGGKDDKGQAQWWQRYQQFANLERNKLFGAALTPGEAAEFNKAMVNPGMKPDQIEMNLTRQREVASKALSRIVNSMVASGYNREAIEAATGVPLGDLPAPQGGVAQGQPRQSKTANPATESKSPKGVYTGPDNAPVSWQEIEATAKNRGISTDEVIGRLGLKPTGMQ